MSITEGAVIWEWSLLHELVIDCTILNSRNEPYYFFDPDPPYIIPQEDGRLLVVYAWLPHPDTMDVTIVQKPGVVPLANLAEIQRTVRVPIPVELASAYSLADLNRDPIGRDATVLQIAVGYFPLNADQKLVPAWCHNKEVQTLPIAATQQAIMVSRAIPLRVPLQIQPPVPTPFEPVSESASPLIVAPKFHESLALKYTLRNNAKHGLFAAVPERPLLSMENNSELHIRMGPPTAAPRGAAPVPAVHIPPNESVQHTVPLEQPVFSDQRPPFPFPPSWMGRDVRATKVHFTQVWWDDTVTALLPGDPTKTPEKADMPPAAFALQRSEKFTDDESRILLWKGQR